MHKATVLLLTCTVALLTALATRPDQAAHERRGAIAMGTIQSSHLDRGEYLRWLVAKGVDRGRTGSFKDGVLTSSYKLNVASIEVARCTGVLGLLWCRQVGT